MHVLSCVLRLAGNAFATADIVSAKHDCNVLYDSASESMPESLCASVPDVKSKSWSTGMTKSMLRACLQECLLLCRLGLIHCK